MKMVPIFFCRNMQVALDFYIHVLDFELLHPQASADDWVVNLTRGDAVIQLTSLEGDQPPGLSVNVWVPDVDRLFAKYKSRGLDTSLHPDSPVHKGPLNQTWGRREFYVTDPYGNTLRFGEPLPNP